uniref:MI domain-containing protein n=1 Tax=Syphacia muris TaxID=451379 RepID=A0A0N5AU79_9BILA
MAVGSNVQLVCKRKQTRKKMKKLRKLQRNAYASRKKVEEVIASKFEGGVKRKSKTKKKKSKAKSDTSSKNAEIHNQPKFEMVRALREDEAEIKKFSKLLGYNKRKNKGIPKVFAAEGLDYILEMCDLKKDLKGAPRSDNEVSVEASDNGYSSADHSEVECSVDKEEDEEVDEDNEKKSEESMGNSATMKEDIYGRTIDEKSGKIISSVSTARKKLDELNEQSATLNNESRVNLERLVRGVVNRLNEGTLVESVKRLKDIFLTHSHNGELLVNVKQMLYKSLQCAITVPYRLPDRIIIEIATFIALLHSTVAVDLSSYFVENFTLNYLKNMKTEEDTKTLENMTVLIAELYNFKVIKDQFISDLMDRLLKAVGEKLMECAKLLLSYTGILLKKRNFSVLQKCIANAQNVIYNLSEEVLKNNHLRFVTEEFLDVKNGNIRKWTDVIDSSLFEHYFSLYRGILKKEGKVDELGMNVTDIEQIDERGRWWLIGSACNATLGESQDLKEIKPSSFKEVFDPSLMDLARRANMKTPVRKEVFCTLLSSEDEYNAFENLLRLSLKGQQEREIVHICLHCALQEAVYNPFYSAVLERFCLYHKRFKLTTQYAIWDRLKNLSNFKKWQQDHLATITAELIIKRSVSVTILKVIEFRSINGILTDFLCRTLRIILTRCSNSLLMDIFGKVVTSPAHKVFSQGLQIFIHMVMKDAESETVLSKINLLDSIWGDDRL